MNMEAMGIFDSGESKEERVVSERVSNDSSMQLGASRNTQWQSNQNTMIKNSKIESKEHKWKEAPIMGFEEREETEEPRTHHIKPTTQAKVIRVVDGKS